MTQIKSRIDLGRDLLRDSVSYNYLAILYNAGVEEPFNEVKEIADKLAHFGLEKILDPLTYALNTHVFRKRDRWRREKIDPISLRLPNRRQLTRIPAPSRLPKRNLNYMKPFIFTSEDGLWSSEDGALEWSRKCFRDQEDPETNTYKELVILSELFDDVDVRSRICQGSDYVSLVDLGCGNGEKAKAIIERLTDIIVCYYPVDKGMFMNAVALTNLADLGQRKDCILADQNSLIYEIASRMKHSSQISLEYLLTTARDALKFYDVVIRLFSTSEDLPKISSQMSEANELVSIGKITWKEFYATSLERIIQRRREIAEMLSTKDRALLQRVYFFHEILGKSCIEAMKIRTIEKNEKIQYVLTGKGDFSDQIRILALGYTMTRYDWERIILLNSSPYLIKELDLLPALDNQRGFIQYTVPSIGINSDFNDIDKIMEVLNYLHIFQEEPRLVALLGQTLGNFDDNGRKDLVRRLYNNLSSGDMALFGVELRPENNDSDFVDEINRILNNYSADEQFARNALPKEKRDNQELKYKVTYDLWNNDVVIKFTGNEEEMLVARSHKFSVDELDSLFCSVGFRIIGKKFYTGINSERKEYAVILCQKVEE